MEEKQPCAICQAETPTATMFHSSRGMVCPSCNVTLEDAGRQEFQSATSSGGSRGGSILIRIAVFVGILIILNVLSAAFDWGYWFY